MRFLPVLDICSGIVVRALAGRRSEYRPLVSKLTDSTDPVTVARAIRDRFGWDEFYIADLDSISAKPQAARFERYDRLRSAGFLLWLDAGVRTVEDAVRLADGGIERVVVGLETVRGPSEWRTIVQRLGADRAVFSLDMRDGKPISAWEVSSALAIVDRVVADGGRRLIVLDLARVGVGGGPGTEELCADLVHRHPGLAVCAGGGIRGWDDVQRLEAVGVEGVLVASALHEERLSPAPET